MIRPLLAAAVAVLVLSACSTAPTPLFPYQYRVDDLDNGLRLVTIPNDYPDIAALHILVGTGSRNEIEPGKSGFAHFFEHMMFRGSKNYTSAQQAELFKEIGAGRNAYTTDDFTNYHTTFAKEDLEMVLKLEADRFRHLEYERKVFRTESQAVFGEYNKNSANPISKIFEVVRDTAFQVHPYKHTTMGFLADIVKMPRQYDYSRTFFDRWYKPEYVTLVVTGDVDRDRALELTKKYFGDWKRGGYTVDIPSEPPQKEALTCHVEWRNPTQPWLAIAFRGPAFDPADGEMPALDVLSSVAFSPSSEVYKKLFVAERKVDALFAYFPDRRDPYLLMVCARLKDAADLTYVRNQILSTCESLKTTAVSEGRLAKVKANLKYSFAAGLDSTDSIASGLASYVALTRDPGTINTLYAAYDKVQAADLQRVAKRYFVADASTTCTLLQGPKPEFGPVTLVDAPLESPDSAGKSAPTLPETLEFPDGLPTPEHAVLTPSRSPLVTFRIVFPTGSAADPAGKEGLARITAEMLTSGATAKRSYDQVVAAFFPMAAGLGTSVDKQMTVFAGTVHRDNLPGYYGLVREMLTEPGFRQEDLDRIRANTVTAIDAGLRRSDDEETGKEVLYQEIYAGHPFGHLTLGSIESVGRITLADVKKFYAEQLRHPFLGISGGYPAGLPGLVAADLVRSFGPTRALAESQDFRKGVRPIAKNRLTLVDKDTRATGIHVGFPIDITRGHPDWIALWLVRSYFGEHRSENSYLYQRLREARGLNYGDYAYIEYFPHGGGQFQPSPNLARTSQIFQIWIRPVPPKNAAFAFRAVLFELERLVEGGMSEANFEATRNYLAKHVNLLVASQDRQLGYAIDSRFYGTGSFVDYVKAGLERLTLADVNRVIRSHLRSDRLQIVVVTPDAAGFRDRVLGEAETPIEYESPPDPEFLAEDKIIRARRPAIDRDAVRILPIDEVFRGR